MENSTYTTVLGDTWDIISQKVYGDEKYVDVLMANNLSKLDNCIFSAGVVLSTPALSLIEDEGDDSYPDWRNDDDE